MEERGGVEEGEREGGRGAQVARERAIALASSSCSSFPFSSFFVPAFSDVFDFLAVHCSMGTHWPPILKITLKNEHWKRELTKGGGEKEDKRKEREINLQKW